MGTKPASPSLLEITNASVKGFSRDQCGRQAAALAYFTVFAVPPSFLLLVSAAGLLWNPDAIQQALDVHLARFVGADAAGEMRQMIASGQQTSHGSIGRIFTFAALFFGASGAFLSLQEALNGVWHVRADSRRGRIRQFVTRRLLSLGMVASVAVVILLSLVLTTAISALRAVLGTVAIQVVNVLLSIVVLSVLFATLLKFLPDARITWRSVWLGGVVTALLLEIGNVVIGLYLSRSKPGDAFGAASALVLILVWIYYGGFLVLFGAEFTQHYAEAHGEALAPKEGAVQIEVEERIVGAERDG